MEKVRINGNSSVLTNKSIWKERQMWYDIDKCGREVSYENSCIRER